MTIKTRILTILAILIFLPIVAARTAIPSLTGEVVDQAGVLSRSDLRRVTEAVRRFNQNTGAQMSVLIMSDIEGESLEEFTIKVVDAWQLGDKEREDGLLLFLSMKERYIRFEVGRGLEGEITDGRAGRVRDEMIGIIQQQGFVDAIILSTEKLQEFVTGESVALEQGESDAGSILVPIFFFVLIILMSLTRTGRTILILSASGASRGGGFRGGGGGFSGGGGGFRGGGGGFSGGGASGRW